MDASTKSKAYDLWAAIIHKSYMYALSMSLLTTLPIYGEKYHKKEGNAFSSSGLVITQPDSLLVVKFDFFIS